ncbi:MAG: hypothetical protein AAF665_06650 [Pseudomonadota bacterium]
MSQHLFKSWPGKRPADVLGPIGLIGAVCAILLTGYDLQRAAHAQLEAYNEESAGVPVPTAVCLSCQGADHMAMQDVTAVTPWSQGATNAGPEHE